MEILKLLQHIASYMTKEFQGKLQRHLGCTDVGCIRSYQRLIGCQEQSMSHRG